MTFVGVDEASFHVFFAGEASIDSLITAEASFHSLIAAEASIDSLIAAEACFPSLIASDASFHFLIAAGRSEANKRSLENRNDEMVTCGGRRGLFSFFYCPRGRRGRLGRRR